MSNPVPAPSVIVTGASGFVGRAALEALLARGVRTTAVTRDRNRLAAVSQRVAIVEGDIAAANADLFETIARHDVLLHLAWDGLPNYKSLHHFDTELVAQFRFLSGAVSRGLGSLVVAGTCFEYGMRDGELREDSPCLPDNPYGYAKDALRRQLSFLKRGTPFNLTWARLFYMYGAGQSPKSIFSMLSAAAARGDEHFDMSGGEQLRDYLPIEQVADHLADLTLRQSDAGIVNVCSGMPRSMRSIVETWMRDNGWRIHLRLGTYPYPDYEPFAFWGNSDKLHALSSARDREPG